MKATASPSEIERFRLLAGDVLITKDSEMWNDIAVPAYVPEDIQDVLCGYHLAQVRPCPDRINGKYLYFAFMTHGVREQFHIAANGITRYGLSQPDIKAAWFPLPPRDEQDAIVTFLDRKLGEIDHFIAKKRRMIDLLEEQKQIVATELVFGRSFNRFGRKVEGIHGEVMIPPEWNVLRARYVLREVDERSTKGEETHLSMVQGRGLVPAADIDTWRLHSESYAGGKVCRPGDLVLNRLKAHLSVFAPANCVGVISPDYSVYRMLDGNLPRYFELLFKTPNYNDWFRRHVSGITEGLWRLYTPDFYCLPCVVPPPSEQKNILAKYAQTVADFDDARFRIDREIDLIQEFRMSLIAEAVTGKINVRSGQ